MVRASDGDTPIAIPSGGHSRLTALERTVLAVSATGLVVAEIADVLGLTPEAVREVLESSMAKLGARSKLEALVLAIRHGLVDLPPS